MQIKFSDPAGTVIDVLAVNGQSINFQGANRDSLEIQIGKSAIAFDALDKLIATQANTAHLTLIDGDKQYAHDNYNLRVSLALKPVVTTPATASAAAVTEDRLCVTLAQKTYQEQQVEQLQSSVDALTLSALGAK